MAKKKRKSGSLLNRKARFEYTFIENFEAGIVLTGDEIKAVRENRLNLAGSHVKIIGGEAFWIGGIISANSTDQQRTRKLLLHKKEIEKIVSSSDEKGLTIIPTKMYIKRGRAKLEIALSRGKKLHDKRNIIKTREQEIEAGRELKQKY